MCRHAYRGSKNPGFGPGPKPSGPPALDGSIFFLSHVRTVNFLIQDALEPEDDSTAIAEKATRETGPHETTKPLKTWFLGGSPYTEKVE